MTDALKSVAGANDAALGNVKNPENSSAIVAVQTANAAPLALTKIAYLPVVETTSGVIDMTVPITACVRSRSLTR